MSRTGEALKGVVEGEVGIGRKFEPRKIFLSATHHTDMIFDLTDNFRGCWAYENFNSGTLNFPLKLIYFIL